MPQTPYVTIRSRRPVGGGMQSSPPSGPGPASATHDISRTSYHVKHISHFAHTLEESASRAFPNRARSTQRYKKVHALLLHWSTDDLFVLPELEDLEKCLREDYAFETEIFAIPADNAHLDLMMRIGRLIKEDESQDTLFLIYYGGHARIDEARQSRWCATRNPDSPWLQWSAIQTLLERSVSDILILLDCCAGAASATFSSGNSTTETISASSWDAIAPDPGRYSFTNALIEVLQEWHHRTFSAAMLHAEVLARLKHPRPIMINGKYFEARSTPVHFMMTSDHKAPSIEVARIRSCDSPPPPPPPPDRPPPGPPTTRRAGIPTYDPVFADSSSEEVIVGTPESSSTVAAASGVSEPDEQTPHVMISLALEDDQRLDLGAWETWLASFPALAKYVKVQGVFKSHSTLLLLSMPVMIWDLLPEDHATSFVAFIRSNNMAMEKPPRQPVKIEMTPSVRNEFRSEIRSELRSELRSEIRSELRNEIRNELRNQSSSLARNPSVTDALSERGFFDDGTTITPSEISSAIQNYRPAPQYSPPSHNPGQYARPAPPSRTVTVLSEAPSAPMTSVVGNTDISRALIYNQHRSGRRTTFGDNVPEPPNFANHIETRLEHYFQRNPQPSDAEREFIASNLGVEAIHVEAWYHFRRERDVVIQQLEGLGADYKPMALPPGPRMILAGSLNELLELSLPGQVLLVDLRAPTEFERSHIHGAANLRAPVSFLRQAPFEMIEAAFTDDQSRRAFATWQMARCIVFYSRALESAWECPAAEILAERFGAWGWDGDVYVLKGHYREFSASFGRHIGGARMTGEGREHADALRRRSVLKEDFARSEREYATWRGTMEAEDLGARAAHSPTEGERQEALRPQEEELERWFRATFPELRRAMANYGPDNTREGRRERGDDFGDMKAQMVGPLERGLTKMREAGGKASPPAAAAPTPVWAPGYSKVGGKSSPPAVAAPTPERAPGHSKAAEGYFDLAGDRPSSGEYEAKYQDLGLHTINEAYEHKYSIPSLIPDLTRQGA